MRCYQFNGYSQWFIKDKFKLPAPLHSFGAVFRYNRIIIIFGGYPNRNSVYYLDVSGDVGWVHSKFKLPKGDRFNALLMDKDTIHIMPFYSAANYHYICNILL